MQALKFLTFNDRKEIHKQDFGGSELEHYAQVLGVTIFRGTERGRESFDDSGSICIKTSILNRNDYVRTGENDSNTDT